MISPSWNIIGERSPHPVKRRTRRKSINGEEPAITVLPPDPNMNDYMRSPSPGAYRTAPVKAANSKGVSSFVILGEMLNTPVQSRPASPSGRVSPFRGHAFKSPATSRATSPTPATEEKRRKSITGKPVVPKKPPPKPFPKPASDIGLPPKSPKRARPRLTVKNTTVQKTNLGVENTKPKPNRTPRPVRKPLNVVDVKQPSKSPKPTRAGKVTNKKEITITPTPKDTDLDKVSEVLSNLTQEGNSEPGGVNQITDTLVGDNKMPKTESSEVAKLAEEGVSSAMEKIDEKVSDSVKAEGEKKSEKLIPCFQPDKCHIAPPTMASPSPIIASAINAPSITSGSALTKTTESLETSQTTVTTTSLNALSSALTISGNLARRSKESESSLKAVNPAVEESEQKSSDSTNQVPDSTATSNGSSTMPPHAQALSPSVQKPEANKEDEISTTNLIKVDSELELLSANSLRDSPPRPPNPAWNEERLVNGDVPSNAQNQGRFKRFFAALWNIIKYLFCCRCFLDCCRKSKCCKKPNCCRKSEQPTQQKSCFPKLNCGSCCSCCKGPLNLFKCCGKSNCCKCKKLKCCDGGKCCKRKPKTEPDPAAGPPPPKKKKFRCAKVNCSCKDCGAKMKNCCLGCRDSTNNCCRSLFCLNLICCQRFLRKCCRSCHNKWKCCQKGGCCSCFNPNVRKESKRPRLDKRASTQSKADQENLDAVLVEHVSLMKAAIPVLPVGLAVLCLIFNMFLPGTGTIFSGMFCLCFGKPRFSVKDSAKNRVGSFCVNLVIGIAQLFTIIFCLVGWGWSIWWGVIMYKLARKRRRIKMAEKSTLEANSSSNHVDIEKGT